MYKIKNNNIYIDTYIFNLYLYTHVYTHTYEIRIDINFNGPILG
jgi:hypothetical protein